MRQKKFRNLSVLQNILKYATGDHVKHNSPEITNSITIKWRYSSKSI